MKVLLLFFLVLAFSHARYRDPIKKEWQQFKNLYKKSYSNAVEERYRMKIFSENRKYIRKHNKGNHTFTMGINEFADLQEHEFKKLRTCIATSHTNTSLHNVGDQCVQQRKQIFVPAEMDWRTMGAVTQVKDQGQCGSCWAFSTTGALEGAHFRATGQLVSLSEQNLVDCADYLNPGCSGGLMDLAFLYVIGNGGIDTEGSYPYEAQNDYCRYNPNNRGSTSSGLCAINAGDENDLLTAVANIGPISVGIYVSGDRFRFYKAGVYIDEDCFYQMNHGVLIVGYGTENGQDYWLVKNSWGGGWGDAGYIKMARNRNNQCGIASSARYPIVKS